MKIQLTLDLSNRHAQLLRSWASVGRLMDSTSGMLELLVNEEPVDHQDAIYAQQDFEMMRGAISDLCSQVRQALVNQNVPPLWDPTGGEQPGIAKVLPEDQVSVSE